MNPFVFALCLIIPTSPLYSDNFSKYLDYISLGDLPFRIDSSSSIQFQIPISNNVWFKSDDKIWIPIKKLCQFLIKSIDLDQLMIKIQINGHKNWPKCQLKAQKMVEFIKKVKIYQFLINFWTFLIKFDHFQFILAICDQNLTFWLELEFVLIDFVATSKNLI